MEEISFPMAERRLVAAGSQLAGGGVSFIGSRA